jgi:hypothetical protein
LVTAVQRVIRPTKFRLTINPESVCTALTYSVRHALPESHHA